MSNNTNSNFDNHAGLKMLQDIFNVGDMFKLCFPAFLKDEIKKEKDKKPHCSHECRNKCCNTDKQKTVCKDNDISPDTDIFKICKHSLCRTEETEEGLVYTARYSGIKPHVADNFEMLLRWASGIYKEHFLRAYKINMACRDGKKEDAAYVVSISFEFYAADDKKANLAITPWKWDADMFTFFHEDETGEKHYVRFLNRDGEIIVCEKDGLFVTDTISDNEREMFIAGLKEYVNDNSSSFDDTKDNSSYKSEDSCSGINFDNNCEKEFDNIFEKEEHEQECGICDTDYENRCDADEDGDGKKCYDESPEETFDKKETLGDIVCSYGFNVRGQSVRDNNDTHPYSFAIKKVYKDILYDESNTEDRTLSNKEMITLFEYMLENRLYDYSVSDTKVILSVSYEDMMQNINKSTYDTPCPAPGSNLPWFMTPGSAPKRIPTSWKALNKQIFAENIRQYYHFDEVILIDMPSTDEDPYSEEKHCILCTFDAI